MILKKSIPSLARNLSLAASMMQALSECTSDVQNGRLGSRFLSASHLGARLRDEDLRGLTMPEAMVIDPEQSIHDLSIHCHVQRN
jgi:hypothetical protein